MNPGREIATARRRAGLTQAQLAERAGTSQATLSAYETGHKEPSVRTLARLLAATGSRLIVASEAPPARESSARDLAQVERQLRDVLALAEALPVEHDAELRYPPLATLRETA